jgi:hypothetical protein
VLTYWKYVLRVNTGVTLRDAPGKEVPLRDTLNHARPSLRAASGQVWTNFFELPRGLSRPCARSQM